MDFAVQYQLRPDEVTRAFRQGLRHQIRLVCVGLPLVLVAGAGVCALLGAIAPTVGLAAGAVAAPIAAAWLYRRLFGRMAALLCVPATVRVTEDGYEVRTELSTATMRWAMFSRAESTPEWWLLYRNRLFLAFLPRAAFDDTQQAGIDKVLAGRAVAA